MLEGKPRVLIYLYNRLFDPLIQSNFWLYIDGILHEKPPQYSVHLITYEDRRFPLTTSQKSAVEGWQRLGLEWTPLTWHSGTGILSKSIDVFNGLVATATLRTKGYMYIVSLASVAGSFAYLFARLLRMRLFLYQFEPHSEYALENGMWSANSLQFKCANVLERWAASYATVIASGTLFMGQRLKDEWAVTGQFFKIPTVANEAKFLFDQTTRNETREELGFGDKWVLLYPGKFGDLYYREEFAWMYRWLRDEEPRLHLLIVTPQPDRLVHELMTQASVPDEDYTVLHCEYADIHKYYFASDFGIISVPKGASKRFVSNIKVGEYLCAGLPFLITRGVSEDYIHAEEKGVGVVVEDFQEEYIKAAWPEIRAFLEQDPETRRVKCRSFGLEYRGLSRLAPIFRQALEVLTAK